MLKRTMAQVAEMLRAAGQLVAVQGPVPGLGLGLEQGPVSVSRATSSGPGSAQSESGEHAAVTDERAAVTDEPGSAGVSGLAGAWQAGEVVEVAGVSTDSRSISPGQLFVPLVGARFDGHEYVRLARDQGAACALWQADRPLPPSDVPLLIVRDTLIALQELAAAYRRQLKLRVVAVTGSNGKTTTKDIIAELLNTTFRTYKTQGNLNNHIGLPLTILQCAEQTQMLVVEMGMSGRHEISLLSKLARPDVAVITMIGEAHLEQLGSRTAIAQAKLEIVDGLASGGLFIYNGDEPLLQERVGQLRTDIRTIRFGMQPDNDFFASDVMVEEDGATFSVNGQSQPRYHSPLLGTHNVLNALAAIAVAQSLGIHPRALIEPLARLKITGMRTEKVTTGSGTTIINDAYNASPASVRAALEMLGRLRGFVHKIVVLGDMLELGEQSHELHAEIGRELDPHIFSHLFTYGELAQSIALAARTRFPADRVYSDLSKTQLVERLATLADADTIILVKGSRAMKLEEVVRQLQQRLDG